MKYEDKLQFLMQAGCGEQDHSGRSLLDHLIGTADKLVEMYPKCPEYLVDAALFHSIYGTTYFKPSMVSKDERDLIKEIIGEEAESLVWFFCNCQHPRQENIMKLPVGEFQSDLLKLNFVNQEDMTSHRFSKNRLEYYNE